MDLEKYIHFLTNGLTGSFWNTTDCEEKNLSGEVVTMIEELKQLSDALDLRLV